MYKKPSHTNNLYEEPLHKQFLRKPSHTNNLYEKPLCKEFF